MDYNKATDWRTGGLAGSGESIQMDVMNNGANRPHRNRPLTGRAVVPRRYGLNAPAIPRQKYERYLALARQAATEGDVVQREYWYQHAEHYFRMMKQSTV